MTRVICASKESPYIMWAFWARAQPDREMIPVRFFSRDLISSYSASSVSGLRNICIRYLLRIFVQLLYLFGDYVPRTVLYPLVNFGNIVSDDTQTYHDKTARKALQDNDRCEALESGAGIPFV